MSSRWEQAGVEELGWQAEGLRILADCYYPPVPELGGRLAGLESLLGHLGSAAAPHARAMLEHWGEPEELLRDYARLFVGPFSLLAPPYGSVYLDQGRGLMGPSAWAVRRHYQDAGLEPAPDFWETPDHIAAELEFLHYLVACRAQARRAARPDQEALWRSRQADFMQNHLGRWLEPFTLLVEKSARSGFYPELARATRRFILSEDCLAPGRGRSWAPGAGGGGSRGR